MAPARPVTPDLRTIEVHGMTRGSFIVRGALAAGAAYGAAAAGPYVHDALGQGGDRSGDLEILAFALTLEHLEAAFYERAARLRLSAPVRELAASFGNHEREHVEALQDTIDQLGGEPEPPPKVEFGLRDERGFLRLAQTLEETGVSAYNGAATRIGSREVLAAAGQIVQVEARHAAAIRAARGLQTAPRPFDDALEMAAVLKAVEPFVRP